MEHVIGVIIGGIVMIALAYVVINQSSNVAKVAGGATSAYAGVARTFQGK